ncbi:hypothetical protein [Kitasatospora brasiliensis]|uniref:hypothetical protein n=1 Tax=Kitasatospora brasiliensis TaxID=3058040 RepID=UPI0029301290|nr:hypothetical protein [Kitasatospora sp. K002]
MNRFPMKPGDRRVRAYSERDVLALLNELHRRGKKFGLYFPAACTNTRHGQVIVRFGSAPASTLLNLLTLLAESDAEESR